MMRKLFAVAAAAMLLLMGCERENFSRIEFESGNIRFNIKVADKDATSETKAAKSSWEEGDRIRLYFRDAGAMTYDLTDDHSLVIEYSGSEWKVIETPSQNLTSGEFVAFHFMDESGISVSGDTEGGKITLHDSGDILSQEWSDITGAGDRTVYGTGYEVVDGTLDISLVMKRYPDLVRILVPGISAEDGWMLYVKLGDEDLSMSVGGAYFSRYDFNNGHTESSLLFESSSLAKADPDGAVFYPVIPEGSDAEIDAYMFHLFKKGADGEEYVYKVTRGKDEDDSYEKTLSGGSAIRLPSFTAVEGEQSTWIRIPSDQELEESIAMTQSIIEQASPLVEITIADMSKGDESLGKIRDIPGVLVADISPDKSTLAVVQTDGLRISFPLSEDFYSPHTISSPETQNITTNGHPSLMSLPVTKSGSPNVPDNRRALILAPFQHEFCVNYSPIKNSLIAMGFDWGNIDLLMDEEADAVHFMGSNLNKYDLVLIESHGAKDGELKPYEFGSVLGFDWFNTVIETGSRFTVDNARKLVNMGISADEIGILVHDGQSYIVMNNSFLKDYYRKGACIILATCDSATIQENTWTKQSLVRTFMDKGAGLVFGATESIKTMTYREYIPRLFELLALGIPFQDAFTKINSADFLLYYLNTMKQYCQDLGEETHGWNPNRFKIFTQNDSPYYVYNYNFSLSSESKSNGAVRLSWSSSLKDWFFTWDHTGEVVYGNVTGLFPQTFWNRYEIDYDVYVDGRYYKSYDKDAQSLSVDYTPSSSGTHEWYIVAKISDNDGVISSVQSDVHSFTVSPSDITINYSDVSFSPTYISFGSSFIGKSLAQDLVIKNNSKSNLVISGVDIPAGFKCNGSFPMTLSSGQSYTFRIEFRPENVGRIDGYFRFHMNTDRGYTDILAVGTGVSKGSVGYAVDLGLPSGVKWASWNVGASSPKDAGASFRWGDTNALVSGYPESYSGNPSVLPLSNDAARANWGGSWRMPTKDEIDELAKYCQFTYNYEESEPLGSNWFTGTYFKVTGPNGNSIYLPAVSTDGKVACSVQYWSSSLMQNELAYGLQLIYNYIEDRIVQSDTQYFSRGSLCLIRPVMK